MARTVVVPWYATGFRADQFERDLSDIAAVALRYGASSYAVYRSNDDAYRFQQFAAFAEKLDWERYWDGPEMTYFRASHSSWYQVPVLYAWWTESASGAVDPGELPSAGNGHGNGHRVSEVG
jgi:hypothetical protein